jgi:hypothetical protein
VLRHGVRHHRAVACPPIALRALTGRDDGPPLDPPATLLPRLGDIAARVDPRLDVEAVLTERAAAEGLARRGATSCGGAARLLPSADGWIALSLARPDDVELLPAWLGLDPGAADDGEVERTWAAVAEAVAARPGTELLDAAEGLGLPVAVVGERAGPEGAEGDLPVLWRAAGDAAAARPPALGELAVLDLTSLWAGPLCGALLADLGAAVCKVESTARPDGARAGSPALWERLNGKKELLSLDLGTAAGRARLRELAHGADVVLEASRPRALRHLGLVAEEVLAAGRPRVWVSLTAHGRTGPGADRVGFGDDAAAAGGLVAWDDDGPVFCGDAIADPTSGLTAAAAVVEALARGGRWLVDVPMAAVSAHLAGR